MFYTWVSSAYKEFIFTAACVCSPTLWHKLA